MSSSIFVITPGILKEEKEYAFLELRAKVQKKGSFNLIPVIGFSREVSILKAIFDLWSWVWMQNYKKKNQNILPSVHRSRKLCAHKKKIFLWVHRVVETILSTTFLYRKKCFLPIKKAEYPPSLDLQLCISHMVLATLCACDIGDFQYILGRQHYSLAVVAVWRSCSLEALFCWGSNPQSNFQLSPTFINKVIPLSDASVEVSSEEAFWVSTQISRTG